MKCVFRTDGSTTIGMGHVVRCLALADELRARSHDISFVMRPLDGVARKLVEAKGFRVDCLSSELGEDMSSELAEISVLLDDSTCDWIIIDHYGTNVAFESGVSSLIANLMVIDDWVTNKHSCNLLLNPGLEVSGRQISGGGDCLHLYGPDFVLLRKEFALQHKSLELPKQEAKEALVMFGGSDASNESAKAIRAIINFPEFSDWKVNVVLGPAVASPENVISAFGDERQIEVYQSPDNLVDIMARSALSIGAGGTTIWENCCLGIASIIAVVADNQVQGVNYLVERGAAIAVQNRNSYRVSDYSAALSKVIEQGIGGIAEAGYSLVDGLGCQRVAEKMEKVGEHA